MHAWKEIRKKKKKIKKSCEVQTLSYPRRLPGLVQRGGDQTAAEFISCWLFHIPFHPTYSHPSPQTYSFPVISRLWLWELPGLLWLLPPPPPYFYESNQWTKKNKKKCPGYMCWVNCFQFHYCRNWRAFSSNKSTNSFSLLTSWQHEYEKKVRLQMTFFAHKTALKFKSNQSGRSSD